MAYNTLELSSEQARPIELYTFTRAGTNWRYTSTDEDFVLSGITYKTAVIERNGLEQGSEMNRSALTLTVQRDLDIAVMYQAGPPSDVVTLVLQQVHYGDSEARMLWTGRIISVTTWDSGKAKIFLEPVYTSLKRNGLRRLYQRACPHVLYGPQCKVAAQVFRATGNCVSVSGTTVEVNEASAFSANWFAGGYLEWQTPSGLYERRFIESSSGSSLICTVQPIGLTAGRPVSIYYGCDHLIATCSSKFQNSLNFGGMPYIPSVNPFGGGPIY